MKTDLSQIISAMSNPEIYPEPANEVKMIQTQMSVVFLAGEFVYKVKKPVNLGYVDYTTLERRLTYCQRELELNRRLCPRAYLGVVSITSNDGGIQIEGDGETVEYAVKMRRLPAESMLDTLLSENKVTTDMMADLAVKIADFHASAETNAVTSEYGSVANIRLNTEENFHQTDRYIGTCISEKQLSRIKDFTHRFIDSKAPLFEARTKGGKIRDCHGDLQAAHVCFCLDLCIYDCIEFNERFRYGDVAAEVAFLAMDIDHLGRADLSRSFIDAYVAHSQDEEIPALLMFYKCYRAYIRGKVNCFKVSDPYVDAEERHIAIANAREYFGLATAYTRAQPWLIIMNGMVGSGKSTIARRLSSRLGLIYISSDVTRKQLAGMDPFEHRFDEPQDGLYSADFTALTYRTILERASAAIQKGDSVIIDAAFLKHEERMTAVLMADKVGAESFIVECDIQPELAQERLTQRLTEVTASDGRWDIFVEQQRWREPVVEVPLSRHITVDAASPLEENITRIAERII